MTTLVLSAYEQLLNDAIRTSTGGREIASCMASARVEDICWPGRDVLEDGRRNPS